MKIILDSSIFVQDFLLRGTEMTILLEGLQLIPASLSIPQIVIDETVNKYKERVIALNETLRHANRDKQCLFGTPQHINELDVDSIVGDYRELLIGRLSHYATDIMEYPKLSVQSVVERELRGGKPFKKSGAGFRDYIIWATVRQVASATSPGYVCFVSANHSDFGKAPDVFPELRSDLQSYARLKYYNSLKDLNKELILPKIHLFTDLDSQIPPDVKIDKNRIVRWIQEHFVDLIREYDFGREIFNFSRGDVTPRRIEELKSVKLKTARRLSNDIVLVDLTLEANLIYNTSASWEDFTADPTLREFFGGDSEQFAYTDMEVDELTTACVRLTYNEHSQEIESTELLQFSAASATLDYS